MKVFCPMEKKQRDVQPADDPHRIPLSRAPQTYEAFCNQEDGCIKIVLDPAA